MEQSLTGYAFRRPNQLFLVVQSISSKRHREFPEVLHTLYHRWQFSISIEPADGRGFDIFTNSSVLLQDLLYTYLIRSCMSHAEYEEHDCMSSTCLVPKLSTF